MANITYSFKIKGLDGLKARLNKLNKKGIGVKPYLPNIGMEVDIHLHTKNVSWKEVDALLKGTDLWCRHYESGKGVTIEIDGGMTLMTRGY